jgi:hypothetical protein
MNKQFVFGFKDFLIKKLLFFTTLFTRRYFLFGLRVLKHMEDWGLRPLMLAQCFQSQVSYELFLM